MTLTLLLLLATAVPNATDHTWGAARWGLTVPQVHESVPCAHAAIAADQDMATNPLTNVRLKSSATLFGRHFSVYYEFRSDRKFEAERLVRISLLETPYDGRATDTLITGLTSWYGGPVGDEKDSTVRYVQWEYQNTTVILSEMKAESYVKNAPLLTIVFQPPN